MKIAQLLSQDLTEALQTLGRQKLAMRTSYNIKKIVKRVNEELDNYNSLLNDARQRNSDAEGKVNEAAFLKDYQELVNLEVDIGIKIDIAEIMETQLSAKDLSFLEPFLNDPEAEAKADTAKSNPSPKPSKKKAQPSQAK